MGHLFNITRYKQGDMKDFYEAACFSGVERLANTEILYRPSHKYVQMSEKSFEDFVKDVLEACPGVVEQLDTWKFKMDLSTRFRARLGVASLLRYTEEFWKWVKEYYVLRDRGIPRDVALFSCNLSGDAGYAHCGHAFSPSFTHLKSFRDFTLKDSFLANVDEMPYGMIWNAVQVQPWFNIHKHLNPDTFDLTYDKYLEFMQETPPPVSQKEHYAIS
jgi:hypothetical protein